LAIKPTIIRQSDESLLKTYSSTNTTTEESLASWGASWTDKTILTGLANREIVASLTWKTPF
jgi:hypothetical protein